MATLHRKINFLRGLMTRQTAYDGPFYATVDVTRRCNLRCPGCRYHTSSRDMSSPGDQSIQDLSLSLFKKLCAELKDMRTPEIVLSGEGEPLLHSDIFDLIAAGASSGFRMKLFTNGTLLTEANCQRLFDAGLHTLQVSLWANSSQEYEEIYAGSPPATFEKVVAGVKRLMVLKHDCKSRYPKVVLHQPITAKNIQQIEGRIELQRLTGCDALSFSVLRTMRNEFTHEALTLQGEERLREVLPKMRRRLDALCVKHNIADVLMRYKIGERVWEKAPCYIPWIEVRIKVDGTVLICDQSTVSLGNIKDSSFAQIWNNEPFRQLRRKASTKAGLAALAKEFDCNFCCFVLQNRQVHRIMRWLTPFTS